MMGDKIEAKRTAKRLGIPVVPGSEGGITSDERGAAHRPRDRLSGAGQGGGRRRRARHEGRAQRGRTCRRARRPRARKPRPRSATTPSIWRNICEKPRHIEIQVLGDGKGNAIHLGERDCSLQRRHQKVLGGKPLARAQRRRARRDRRDRRRRRCASCNISASARSSSSTRTAQFYFIEMNTRIQVEHPVTEMITDIDLVLEQIRVAAGADLALRAERRALPRPRDRVPHQCREPGVLPPLARQDRALSSARRARRAHRFSASIRATPSRPITTSLVGKLIVHGKTRGECLMRLQARARRVRGRRHRDHPAAVPRAGARAGHHRRRLSHPLAGAVPRQRRDGGVIDARIRRARSGGVRFAAVRAAIWPGCDGPPRCNPFFSASASRC